MTQGISWLGFADCWLIASFIAMSSSSHAQNAPAIAKVEAGVRSTCALTTSGAILCWGANNYGQLGDATTQDRSTPVPVSNLANATFSAIAVGAYHACALASSGNVYCWGRNNYGQLGVGTTATWSTPMLVSGLSNVRAIAAGGYNTCALTNPGGLYCWGWNDAGQVGDGSSVNRLTPSPVSGLGSGVTAIAVGYDHSCAVVSGGAVKCWGWNQSGSVGDGSTTSRYVPVKVVGLTSGVASVAAGEGFSCALGNSGNVMCWGLNWSGEVGDGSTTNRLTPVPVTGLASSVVALAAGAGHGCALLPGGAAKCWGYNEYGQLGDGTTSGKTSPVSVSGLPANISAIAAGDFHTCAATVGSGLVCWGENTRAQVGDGTTTNRSSPVWVSGYGASSAVPGNCSINQSPDTVSAPVAPGTTVQLTLTCATGNPPSSCNWSSTALQSCTTTVTAPATDATVSAIGINAYGSSPLVITTLRVRPKVATTTTVTGLVPQAPNTLDGVTVSVSVTTNSPGAGTPTGTLEVVLIDGSGSCSMTLPANGCLLRSTSSGNKAVRASYSGDATFAASSSASLAVGFAAITSAPQLPAAGGSGNVGLDVGCANCTITAARMLSSSEVPPLPDRNFTFPYGVADFTVAACGAVAVTLTFPATLITGTPYLYKLVRHAGQTERSWSRIAATSVPSADGTRIAFTFTVHDGVEGEDDDLAVNCEIADPVGMAVSAGSVVEFHNSILDNYFITAETAEAGAIDRGAAGPGWSRTGGSFPAGGDTAVCRFYGSQFPGPNSHFYTIDPAECQSLKNIQSTTPATQKRWNFESYDFLSSRPVNGSCPAGTIPVYRAYNYGFERGIDSNHRISMDLVAIQQVLSRGWKNEGIVMCAPASDGGSGGGSSGGSAGGG